MKKLKHIVVKRQKSRGEDIGGSIIWKPKNVDEVRERASQAGKKFFGHFEK